MPPKAPIASSDGSPEQTPSSTPAVPLRIGLLVDGRMQPAWVEAVLREVVAARIGEVVLVVENATPPDAPPSALTRMPRTLARIARLFRNRAMLPYVAYTRLDERRYGVPASSPHRPVDLGPLLAGVPVVRVRPRMTKFCDYFEDADVAAIAEHKLDVALRFGFRILKGRALQIARLGVWSYHHGDNRVNRGGPAGFWEVYEGLPTTGSVLQRLTEDLDGGHVLARSAAATDRNSVTATRAEYYWQAAALLPAALRRAQLADPSILAPARGEDAGDWQAYSHRLYVHPRPGEVARLAGRIAWRLLRRRVTLWLTREQWFLAYRLQRPAPAAMGPTAGSLGSEASDDVLLPADAPDGTAYRFRELRPPADRYWADPFPIVDCGRRYVFFEEHLLSSPKAHINVLELDEKGIVGAPARVLEEPFHLSYPFVFRWRDTWYLMPESSAARSVRLYRAVEFPHRWEFAATLLDDVVAVDPTMAHVDGTWWLFVGIIPPGTSDGTALHLFHAPTPLGPWTPHRANPVKVDAHGARPAGRLFRHQGRWYRPGQDGAPAYGTATIVHRIETLRPDAFHEVAVSRLDPLWRPDLVGTHTLNAVDGLTVIDARARRPFYSR